jgi:hypothetical protein
VRIADLIDAEVFDETNRRIGRVNDVRLVQDGPLLGTFGAAFRVDGIVVGVGSFGSRLGFDRRNAKGPAPLKWFFRLLHERSHYVGWAAIRTIEEGRIRVAGRAESYLPPEPIA